MAREIVPSFNAYLYFRVGYALARGLARRPDRAAREVQPHPRIQDPGTERRRRGESDRTAR